MDESIFMLDGTVILFVVSVAVIAIVGPQNVGAFFKNFLKGRPAQTPDHPAHG